MMTNAQIEAMRKFVDKEPLFVGAVELCFDNFEKVSPSHLQRNLGIGYVRATEIIEAMDIAGLCGGWNGSLARNMVTGRHDWNEAKKILERKEHNDTAE